MTELVHLEVRDGVATVTLDSQHNRNALSRQLVAELGTRLETAQDDDSVRAVIVAGSGPVFCSGADLSEAAGEGMMEGARRIVALQRRIVACPKPVVVRLHGPVRAGGLGIVGAADVVVAADSASFAFTEVRLGLAPLTISLTTLPRLTDRAAAQTYLTGTAFDAAEAARIGLVSEVVPDADLDEAVSAVVTELCKGLPQGLRETKRLLNQALLDRIDAQGEAMAVASAKLFASDAARTAMQAFLDRTKEHDNP